MDFIGDKVEVTMDVSKEQQPRITDRSVASLGSISLLGEAAVDITPDSKGKPVPEWGYVPSGAAPGLADDSGAGGHQEPRADQRRAADVRQGRGTLGKLVTDDTLYCS